jgi:nitrite reductase/ring-hydroxylating ferredoxin subunit
MAPIRVCAIEQVPDGGALALEIPVEGKNTPLVAVRRGTQVWVYRNRCPHFSVPLDYEPGAFCTYQQRLLMCAHHSAMFRFEDGHCIDGPCLGARLDSVPVVQHSEALWLGDVH